MWLRHAASGGVEYASVAAPAAAGAVAAAQEGQAAAAGVVAVDRCDVKTGWYAAGAAHECQLLCIPAENAAC